jgi:mannose-1-phosphate guanylyltransferase/phosphomannomutase
MKALLLAAGEGTRLRPLTLDRPKAMVEIAGRPAVAYALDWLHRNGVAEVAINLYHRPDVLQAYVGDGSRFGVTVRYSLEAPRVLGTAGALAPLRDYFRLEDVFLVLYGDVVTGLDLGPVLARHRAAEADVTIVVNRVADPTQSGMVAFDGSGRVVQFVEKPPSRQVMSEWGNAGIYLCGPRVLDYVPASEVSQDFAYDIFPKMLAGGCRLVAYPTSAAVFEFGSIERLAAATAAVGKGLLAVPVRA